MVNSDQSIVVRAREIRLHGDMAGWGIERMVAEIRGEFPNVTLLWAHRLAHGWTRPQLLNALAELYHSDGLMAPFRTSEICRWEKGVHLPSLEKQDYLTRVYRTRPDRLGFGRDHSPGANDLDTQRETTDLSALLEQARQLIQRLADVVAAAERVSRGDVGGKRRDDGAPDRGTRPRVARRDGTHGPPVAQDVISLVDQFHNTGQHFRAHPAASALADE